jgi:hypothetical protein
VGCALLEARITGPRRARSRGIPLIMRDSERGAVMQTPTRTAPFQEYRVWEPCGGSAWGRSRAVARPAVKRYEELVRVDCPETTARYVWMVPEPAGL